MYDYRMEMKKDVRTWIEENADFSEYTDIDDFREKAYDSMFDGDVTGSASGSYTFNSYKAAENLVGNWDLLAEAMKEFCCGCDAIAKGAEWADVTIRCYLLAEVLESVIDADDIAEKIEAAQESKEMEENMEEVSKEDIEEISKKEMEFRKWLADRFLEKT